MSDPVMACRSYNFVGTIHDFSGTADHYDDVRDGVSQPHTICGEAETKEKALAELEKNSKSWCDKPRGYVMRSFECDRFSPTDEVKIIEDPSWWDRLVAIVREYVL